MYIVICNQYMLCVCVYTVFALYLNKCKSYSLGNLISRLTLFAFLYYTSGYLLTAKKKTEAALPLGKWN